MKHSTAMKELNSTLKSLSEEDLPYALYVKNRIQMDDGHRDYRRGPDTQLLRKTESYLKSIQNLKEINDIIINYFSNTRDSDIFYFIDLLNETIEEMYVRGGDRSSYKRDKRKLNFTLHMIKQDIQSTGYYQDIEVIDEIKNKYFKFLYLSFSYSFYLEKHLDLNYIQTDYSKVITENPLHFKKYDHEEFYLWAKGYLDKDIGHQAISNSLKYAPTTNEDYKTVINSIFDILYINDHYAYTIIKEKLLNAWYQKNYRKKNKGKRDYFFLTDDTYACLEILTKKYNVSKNKIIENLINEKYAKECKYKDGSDKYS
ncbi:hypothetical protein KTH71_06505 [Acinetobacter sp. WU_MDCI_Axc73]|nr:hypothetical protein [Acinetobacter sp. WU_MDCI_Axc73]